MFKCDKMFPCCVVKTVLFANFVIDWRRWHALEHMFGHSQRQKVSPY